MTLREFPWLQAKNPSLRSSFPPCRLYNEGNSLDQKLQCASFPPWPNQFALSLGTENSTSANRAKGVEEVRLLVPEQNLDPRQPQPKDNYECCVFLKITWENESSFFSRTFWARPPTSLLPEIDNSGPFHQTSLGSLKWQPLGIDMREVEQLLAGGAGLSSE